ncbi:MAG: efflux RND transporter permease subunit, partial [Cyanobacteria bacterium J06636_28]
GIFGLSLNVFSLGGLALGVGIVVDNAIVMLENITEGVSGSSRPVIRQAEASSQELESALVASTTTNLVAVLPFLLMGGFISLLFSELVVTISLAVAASLMVALTVVPTLAARLLVVKTSSGIGKLWPIRWFGRRLQALTLSYGSTLGWVLQRRVVIIAAAMLMFGGGSWAMFQHIPQEILPSISNGQARVWVNLPPGTTLDENRRVMTAVDQMLIAQPETDYVFSTSGGFLFGNISIDNALRGSSTLTLKPGTDVEAFTERMNQSLRELNLVNTRMRVSPGSVRGLILSNSPVRSDVDIVLQSSDLARLDQAGEQVLDALAEQATLASYLPDADPPQPEIQIRPDWERAADVGISAEEIGQTVETILSGAVPTQLQRGDRLVDVRVQTPDSLVQNPAQLTQLPLLGSQVRLGDVARIENGQSPGEIQRIDQRQVFIIEGRLAEEASLGEALDEVEQMMR